MILMLKEFTSFKFSEIILLFRSSLDNPHGTSCTSNHGLVFDSCSSFNPALPM